MPILALNNTLTGAEVEVRVQGLPAAEITTWTVARRTQETSAF